MNMRYAKRSEDTEQINVVSWAGWNMNRYPELNRSSWHLVSRQNKKVSSEGMSATAGLLRLAD